MHFSRKIRTGFTLVELLISLGIAILLIYGINLVFRAVTDTVRVGNALASATRKMRSVESSLTMDFEGTNIEIDPKGNKNSAPVAVDTRWSGITPVVSDTPGDGVAGLTYDQQPRQPAITIFCKSTFAFLNKADQDNNSDKTDPAVFDEDETGTPITLDHATAFRLNKRVHRVDTIGFFATGTFASQAGVGNGSSASGAALQAWVWYGHLLQPNTTGDFVATSANDLKPLYMAGGKFAQPGQGDTSSAPTTLTETTNPKNYYASDWVLGRMAILLLPRLASTTTDPGIPGLGATNPTRITTFWAENAATPSPIDFNSVTHQYVSGTSGFSPSPATDYTAMPTDPAAVGGPPFTSGLYDLAGVWMGDPTFPGGQAALPTGSVGTYSLDQPASPPPTTPTVPYDVNKFTGLVKRYATMGSTPSWWQNSMTENGNTLLPMRFNTVTSFARPVESNGFMTAARKSAMQATSLARGATDFIVEFAGDFCGQNTDGTIKSPPGPDGVLDFVVIGSGANAIHQTRWYGYPRDIDGDGTNDVDTVKTFVGTAQTFEKVLPDAGQKDSYVVAFGPAELYPPGKTAAGSLRPWLIRLTAILNDSAGNLPNGMAREFVFKVR